MICSHATMAWMAERDCVEIIELMFENTDNKRLFALLPPLAAKHGSMHVLNWAKEKKICMDGNVYSAAAETGQQESMQWALDNQISSNLACLAEAFTKAQKRNDQKTMKWLEQAAGSVLSV
jgi:hypothetical protein